MRWIGTPVGHRAAPRGPSIDAARWSILPCRCLTHGGFSMKRMLWILTVGFALSLLGAAGPDSLEAQQRGKRGGAEVGATVELSVEVGSRIRTFYAERPVAGAEALPPGIRKRLERGKPLPPGIAKKVAPPELTALVPVDDGFQLMEVGLDVLLVEVATGIIHDVLMDVIR